MRKLCAEDAYTPTLLAVAGHGLTTRQFPAIPLSPVRWEEFLTAATKHRVLGHAQAAVRTGELPVTAEQRAQLRSMHRAIAVRTLKLEQTLVEVAGQVPPLRVLKGSAYAHLDYPDPARRSFIDLDLLFKASDFGAAVAGLTGRGYTRILAEPRPGFDARFDKGTTLRGHGVELDLHRTFVLGPWGRLVRTEELWAESEPFVLGGRTMHALAAPYRFLHACYHAALGDWPLRLGSLRDVAQLMPKASLSVVRSWGVEAVVAAAVADATRLLGLPQACSVQDWAVGYVPTGRDEQWLGLHTRSDKTFAAQALATLSTLTGVREKVAYLRALLLPDPSYVEGRHASAVARIRFGVREALRGRGHSGT